MTSNGTIGHLNSNNNNHRRQLDRWERELREVIFEREMPLWCALRGISTTSYDSMAQFMEPNTLQQQRQQQVDMYHQHQQRHQQ
eukprot:CAMPEP_0198273546 /NCGR_PEP_ID=MMETSP1447-20131203/57266_1 /TAXON_ID=420782 /ORGANISM="Chaetoceros dichaeta, Strain CCMP1751" /LENGTH=83 /DNA_ID=CAMNT_0043967283 /DNA_START=42 /DNA_END=290 /DNA_ORIENTATION=+